MAATLQKLQLGTSGNSARHSLAKWLPPQVDVDDDADVDDDGKLTADEVSGALEGFGGQVVSPKGDTASSGGAALQQADAVEGVDCAIRSGEAPLSLRSTPDGAQLLALADLV